MTRNILDFFLKNESFRTKGRVQSQKSIWKKAQIDHKHFCQAERRLWDVYLRFNRIQSYRLLSWFVFCFLFFFSSQVRRLQLENDGGKYWPSFFVGQHRPNAEAARWQTKDDREPFAILKENLIFGDPRYKRKQQKNKTKQTKQFGRPCRRKRPTWNASRHFSGRIHWEKKNKPEFNKEIQWRRESDRLRRGFSSKLISCFFIFILFTRLTPSSFSCCWRSQHSSTKIIFLK